MITTVLKEESRVESVSPPASADWVRPQRRPRSWGWLWYVAFAAAGLAAWAYVPKETWLKAKDWFAKSKVEVSAAPKQRVVPVITAMSAQEDMPLYLNGLGTVSALYTVTLRTRVDGELMKVLFTEGQMVKQGELLAEIDPRPFQVQLKQAEGNLMRDQAALRVAQLDLDRYTNLIGSKSITQQQLDGQKALVQQSEGSIRTDEAQIDNAKLQLRYCRITAPINGRIGLRMVDPGNIVHANDQMGLAVITQLQPINVIFTIPQDDISRVQTNVNKGKTLEVEAFDRDFTSRLASGRLMALDNQVDATTGTVRIKARFDNDDNMLFPNQFVNARLLVDTRRATVTVPSGAVQRGPDSTFVYVVKGDSTVELKNVVVGPTEADRTAIESGLMPGEAVVIDGVDKLQPGAKVEARERGPSKPPASVAGKQAKEA